MTTTIEAPNRIQGRWKPRDVWCALAGVVSLALAVWAASTVAVPVSSDLGLAAVLPYPFWVGVLILNVAFIVALRGDAAGPARRPVMLWLVVVLVLVLFGTAAFVTDVPRGEVAFRHLGIADALSRTEGIDPDIDAYFNWPGFFALLATVLKATGLDPVTVALWAPVLNMGLWLAALSVLTGYLTRDPRRRWLVLWIFCLGNWQDQDYLSPQAFGFFLYLVVIALVLGPLAARTPKFLGFGRADLTAWWLGRSPAEHRPGHRVSALAVTLLLITVICASHQLTPFLVLITVTALTLSGRVWPSRLPLITAVVLALWLVFPASAYLAGNPPLAEGGLLAAIDANVVDRVSGTAGHVLVVQVRVLLTLVLWALATAGAVRDWRRGRLDIRVVLLAVTPLLLFPVQLYGGEMLIRVSLFALPFIALQACSVLLPADGSTRPSSRAAGGLVLTCLLLAGMTVTGRFGNAQYDVFTDNEITAVAAVKRLAPPGSMIISASTPTPWRSEAYLEHRYRTIDFMCKSDLSTATCGPLVYEDARDNPAGAVVLLTRSSEASLVLRGVSSEGSFDELEAWLSAQDGVELVFSNVDARVYRVTP
ncbi:glycosyltransferase [Pseudarthrobacter raffinosi]|uniref:glycosyltransferase n=1 Tax=Pseudarthrobacter raffinosi TaxID=2953651 RepID=UPI00208E5B07|nr:MULTISPECIES: glycosyltransferase [unclassified Pseudarthrobacter]MCO4253040.1 glycosyltransferase [Pseudarthrobacter sp. MDT3-9]MCO4264011.1 glycosyltransferase [Pseudarthrobacter sp. MDT3-26]